MRAMDTNPSHYEVDGADFTDYMEDEKVGKFGQWMFANGYNTALSYQGYEIECKACGHMLRRNWLWCPWCRWEVRSGYTADELMEPD